MGIVVKFHSPQLNYQVVKGKLLQDGPLSMYTCFCGHTFEKNNTFSGIDPRSIYIWLCLGVCTQKLPCCVDAATYKDGKMETMAAINYRVFVLLPVGELWNDDGIQ